MSYSKINVNTLTAIAVTNSDTANIPIVASEGFLIFVGSSTSILQDITPGAGTADPRYVDVKVANPASKIKGLRKLLLKTLKSESIFQYNVKEFFLQAQLLGLNVSQCLKI